MHGTFCTTLCRICIVHICSDICAGHVFTISVQQCEEALYTRVYFYTIVRSFCTVLRSFCTVLRSSRGRGGGMRRFYTHLQPASWRQFCAILCKGGLHCARLDCTVQGWIALCKGGLHWWRCQRGQTTRMDEAPNSAIRSRRQFAKTLEGRTIRDQLRCEGFRKVPRHRLMCQKFAHIWQNSGQTGGRLSASL